MRYIILILGWVCELDGQICVCVCVCVCVHSLKFSQLNRDSDNLGKGRLWSVPSNLRLSVSNLRLLSLWRRTQEWFSGVTQIFDHKNKILKILSGTTIFKYEKCYYSEESDYLYFIFPKEGTWERTLAATGGISLRNQDFLALWLNVQTGYGSCSKNLFL